MMLLSRFWYVVLGLLLGTVVFGGYLAQSMYDRVGGRVLAEGLSADAQVVSWGMRSMARERSAQLLRFALHPDVSAAVNQSNTKGEVPKEARDRANAALAKLATSVPKEFAFDALFAVDQRGRVVGQLGFEQTQGRPFELGGYPLVADALHGYVRDGSFAWKRLHLAVARPIESGTTELPAGAVVGLRTVDEEFAADVSARTGAAIAFYKDGERIAAATPEGFLKADLAGLVRDIKTIDEDEDYRERGRSTVRRLSGDVSAVYSRIPGDAWSLGAGYVVGRKFTPVKSPIGFFFNADDKDKANANWLIVLAVALLTAGLGIGFTVLEHTRPLQRFAALAGAFAAGKEDHVQASRVSGAYRKLATQINDGIDHAVAKGGGSRRAADLKAVLGELPEQPAMSAFDFPEAPVATPPAAEEGPRGGGLPMPPPPRRKPIGPGATLLTDASSAPGGNFASTLVEAGGQGQHSTEPMPRVREIDPSWREIYAEFVATKERCGENTQSLTYEKFEVTLRKNEAAIQQKHNVRRVKFSVYIKDGKAALKASPMPD